MFCARVKGLNHSPEVTGGNCSKLFFLADFVFSTQLQRLITWWSHDQPSTSWKSSQLMDQMDQPAQTKSFDLDF